jgi:flagellar motility protein MotE (MotC chaperone)
MDKTAAPRFLTTALVALALIICLDRQLFAQQDESAEQTVSSVEQRRLEATIASERQILLEEKKALELRENELKTLEEAVDKKLAEIDRKIAELQQQQKKLEEVLARKDVEEQAKVKELSKIYERMAPDKAALALSGLDQRLAADILANMKVKAAAKVLDSLNKQKAVELSETFSTIQLE